MARKRRKLGEIFLHWGLITEKQLKEGLKIAQGSRKRIGETLVDLGYVSQNDVAKALASQFGMEFVDLDSPDAVDKNQLSLIPRDLIKRYQVLPLGKEGNKLKVLAHDPMDLELIDDLRFRLGMDIELSLAAYDKIAMYIDHVLSETRESIDQLTQDLSVDMSVDMSVDKSVDSSMDKSVDKSIDRGQSVDIDAGAFKAESESDDAQQAPIIRLVQQIIQDAVNERASDIHIEPFEDRVRLRFRIDGVCHERDQIPKSSQQAVIARLKIMSGMRVEERRVPQDGRIKLRVGKEDIDFRVSACPAYHGESMVLRILRPEAAKVGLENLGMQPDTLESFRDVIRRPNGIVLVTGPTGSGKTTTLYSSMKQLATDDVNVCTIEDPIELVVPEFNQMQVHHAIGLDFASGLRTMLRQDPDIAMVGEIRDQETAEMAAQAALTGHLVLSTLHTNDAPSAITRLVELGTPPYLISATLLGVMAQRLVRTLCPHCKEPDAPDPEQWKQLVQPFAARTPERVYSPVGCLECRNTGYLGRSGVYELVRMSPALRRLVGPNTDTDEIRRRAFREQMRPMRLAGARKIARGETTIEEVMRVTPPAEEG